MDLIPELLTLVLSTDTHYTYLCNYDEGETNDKVTPITSMVTIIGSGDENHGDDTTVVTIAWRR